MNTQTYLGIYLWIPPSPSFLLAYSFPLLTSIPLVTSPPSPSLLTSSSLSPLLPTPTCPAHSSLHLPFKKCTDTGYEDKKHTNIKYNHKVNRYTDTRYADKTTQIQNTKTYAKIHTIHLGLRKVSERGWFHIDPHVPHEEHAIQKNHVHQMLANKAFGPREREVP